MMYGYFVIQLILIRSVVTEIMKDFYMCVFSLF